MFNYLTFKDKTLLITPDKLKTKIREEIMSLNTLLNIKIMSISEVKNRLLFDYDNNTIVYIYKKYNKPLSIIKNLINYMYYIDINLEYKSNKINELKEIKIDLINNNLLKFDKRFIYNLKQYNIKFLGFPLLTKEDNFIINEIKKYYNVEILNYYTESFNHFITHTTSIEDEIIYVSESISNLLNDGVDINKIKLCNINNDYTFYLKRIFKNYNLPLNLDSDITYYDLPISIEFINLLKENSKEETINILKEKYSEYNDYINTFINILNNYSFLDYIDLDLIKYELKNKKIKSKKKLNSIDIIDIEEIGNRDDYIFVMSCNYNYLPSIKKDEDYLIDIEKEELGISTSKEVNKNNIESIKKLISSSKNIYLSYKDKSYFNEYHKVDYLNHLEVREFSKDIKKSYSINEDKILLTKNLDNNLINNDTLILNYNYDVNYLSYDHTFKGIKEETLYKILKDKTIPLSYSSMSKYYECGFKYYLMYLLKLNKFKDSSSTIIGKIMHEIVDKCNDDDFDFDRDFNLAKEKYIKDYPLNNSEAFFIENIKERTFNMVEFLKKCEDYTSLNEKIFEKKIEINKEYKDYNFVIKGFIDKLIYKEIDNIFYSAIIDMKTGTDKIDPSLFEHGLGLQLPFYIYLLKNDLNDTRFNNSKILGIYIHNILNKVNDESTLKLNGYTVNDLENISKLDNTYTKSSFIKSLAIGKDGNFGRYSKLISNEEIDSLSILVEEKINELMNNIIEGKFDINPKKIEKKLDTCNFCEYKNICYKSLKDYIYLSSEKEGEK